MATLGIVCNLYNEVNALPGWLEAATALADDVRVLHAGPGGAKSDDGTIELLEKWRIPIEYGSIDDGFGVTRTRAIRMSPCDWVMILDADERFHSFLPVLTCTGESTPHHEVDKLLYDYSDPNYRSEVDVVQEYDKSIDFGAVPSNFENMSRLGAKLTVSSKKLGSSVIFAHGEWLRFLMEEGHDAIRTIRRHWHDFTWKHPTQNWHTDPDYQIRIVRNIDSIYYEQETRMHERLVGANNIYQPTMSHGPFFDHYHLHFKKMEVRQRQYDVAVYNAIAKGETPPKWGDFKDEKERRRT
jgi:glycosyltransferase involved in cell wall biosynthesis